MLPQVTLGLLINSTQDPYETAILRGVFTTAHARQANTICFTSGTLHSYHGFEAQRNVLYDLVSAHNVQGLVICGTLAHAVSIEEVAGLCLRYGDIPMVSIALSLPGIPNVMVDSRQGIRSVVAHLVEVHGYQRLAFIRGPLGQQEAEQRYAAYRAALAAYHLPFDDSLVVNGDYTFPSGQIAMQELLRRTGADFRAVISANDSMALGAMEVLHEQGFRIPEDIALTGFDDTLDGRFALAPLSTVRQDAYDQGARAAQMLLDSLAGLSVPEQVIAPAALVCRRSCGCASLPVESLIPVAARGEDWEEILEQNRAELAAEMQKAVDYLPAQRMAAWSEAWGDALITELKDGPEGLFNQALEKTQVDGADLGIELAAWYRSLAAFFHQIWGVLPGEDRRLRLEKIKERAIFHAGQVAEEMDAHRQIELDHRAIILREIAESMMTTFDLAGLLDVLDWELPRLRVNACYLALFADPQHPADWSNLIFAWRGGQRISLPSDGLRFASQELMPAMLWKGLYTYGMIVEALYSKEDRLGFVILEVPADQAPVCNALRSLLSSSLQGVLLLEQRRVAETELLQSQRKLESLILGLESANQELESFAYSVSHDLRAPLRAVVGYSSLLQEDHRDALNEDAKQMLDRIMQSGRRMGMLIDDLLAFSRIGRQALHRQQVNMNEIVHEICEELSPETSERQVEWIIGDLPPAHADPGLIRQVYANLLGNAVKYSAQRDVARIEVGAQTENGVAVYFVRDNGAGFDMRYATRIFGVFQRLHNLEEFEGTGIGLAIVHRIISRHGGKVWAEAEVDRGAVFYFLL